MKNKFDRDFSPDRNTTKCYIHLDNTEITLLIERRSDVFLLSFSHKNRLYQSKEVIIRDQNDFVSNDPSRIRFENIQLHEIDQKNIAKCIDRMINRIFD